MQACQHPSEDGRVCGNELKICSECGGTREQGGEFFGLEKVTCSDCEGRGMFCKFHRADFD
jgi:hypothetical protein